MSYLKYLNQVFVALLIVFVHKGALFNHYIFQHHLIPSENFTVGFHFKTFLIFLISATEFFGSPGRLGKKIFFPPTILAKKLTLCGKPVPTLKIFPVLFVLAAK